MLKKINLLLSLTLSFIVSVNAQEPVKNDRHGIEILPTKLYFNVDAGKKSSQVVHVLNNTSDKIKMDAYLNDWFRDTLGGHLYFKPATYLHSCAQWVTLDKSYIELEPGQAQDITVTMELPDSESAVQEMKWTMLFVEEVHEAVFLPPEKKMGIDVQKNMRIGVHIYQTPPNITNKSLKLLSFKRVADQKDTYRISCKNTGGDQIQVNAYAELNPISVSDTSVKKMHITVGSFPLFPDQKRVVDFTLPKLSKGKYSIIAALDGGGDVPLEAVQSVIEIK